MGTRTGSYLYVHNGGKDVLWVMSPGVGLQTARDLVDGVIVRLPYLGDPKYTTIIDSVQQAVEFSPQGGLSNEQIAELAEATGALLMRVRLEVHLPHWTTSEDRQRHTIIRLIVTKPWILGVDPGMVAALSGVASCSQLYREDGAQMGVSLTLTETTRDPDTLVEVVNRICDALRADPEDRFSMTYEISLMVPDTAPEQAADARASAGPRY